MAAINWMLAATKPILRIAASKAHRRMKEALETPEAAQKHLKEEWTRKLNLDLTGRDFFSDPLIEKKQFSSEAVDFWETTSGSSGPKKYIPYTSSLRQIFNEMAILWLRDLVLESGIRWQTGVFYMSLSPKIGQLSSAKTQNSDADYLNPLLKILCQKFLAVPLELQNANNPDEFMDQVCAQLLRRQDLEALSLWSPSLFLSFLDWIEDHPDRFPLNGNFCEHWPELKFISCWQSAQAKAPTERLAKIFPNATFQGKGLLATEGPLTMPISSLIEGGSIPLPQLVVYEFLDQQQNRLGLQDLKEGETYEILPSFPNGLLRYRIGDQVQVTGFFKKVPLLEFVGRTAEASDLVGEKLSGDLLRQVFADLPILHFVTYPRAASNSSKLWKLNYEILYEGAQEIESKIFEDCLRRIYHYDLARKLGQLGPAKSKRINGLLKLQHQQAREHQHWGDIKEQNLRTTPIEF